MEIFLVTRKNDKKVHKSLSLCIYHFQSPMDNGGKKVQIPFDHPWTTQIISICPRTMEIMSGHPWMMEINSSGLEVRQ
jgi:hypothetical protein